MLHVTSSLEQAPNPTAPATSNRARPSTCGCFGSAGRESSPPDAQLVERRSSSDRHHRQPGCLWSDVLVSALRCERRPAAAPALVGSTSSNVRRSAVLVLIRGPSLGRSSRRTRGSDHGGFHSLRAVGTIRLGRDVELGRRGQEGPHAAPQRPYAITRHPIYTGILGMLLGSLLLAGAGRWLLLLPASSLQSLRQSELSSPPDALHVGVGERGSA